MVALCGRVAVPVNPEVIDSFSARLTRGKMTLVYPYLQRA
jgi:hypothetical protein